MARLASGTGSLGKAVGISKSHFSLAWQAQADEALARTSIKHRGLDVLKGAGTKRPRTRSHAAPRSMMGSNES
jgi:hypothetical protein